MSFFLGDNEIIVSIMVNILICLLGILLSIGSSLVLFKSVKVGQSVYIRFKFFRVVTLLELFFLGIRISIDLIRLILTTVYLKGLFSFKDYLFLGIAIIWGGILFYLIHSIRGVLSTTDLYKQKKRINNIIIFQLFFIFMYYIKTLLIYGDPIMSCISILCIIFVTIWYHISNLIIKKNIGASYEKKR